MTLATLAPRADQYQFPPIIRPEDVSDTPEGRAAGAWLTTEQLRRTYEQKYDTVVHIMRRRTNFSVLELGVRAGYSAEVFLAAGADIYYGIDAESEWWGEPGLVDPAMTSLAKRYPDRIVRWMVANSHYDSARLASMFWGPYDLIHFDGDQFYDGAARDFRDYMELLKPSGVALVDGPPAFSGFDRAARDFARENGWTVQQAHSPFVSEGRCYPSDLILRRRPEEL